MDETTDQVEELFSEGKERTRWTRRKQMWRKIRRNIRINVRGESRKGGGLKGKVEAQTHRLYKGPHWNNCGGYAYNTKNLGPSNRDKRNLENQKEQIEETKHEEDCDGTFCADCGCFSCRIRQ